MTRDELLKEFELFSLESGGIGSWITNNTSPLILDRLTEIERSPLSKVQLNQLLVLGHEAPLSDGFFQYYWRDAPDKHDYECRSIPGFAERWISGEESIVSLEHLKWGLYRLYVDGLLHFGNVRTAYRALRNQAFDQLCKYFQSKRCDTARIKARGPALKLRNVSKDKRYLISEMACKSYGENTTSDLRNVLFRAYREHRDKGGGTVTVEELLSGDVVEKDYKDRQFEFKFSADEVLKETIDSEEQLSQKFQIVASEFLAAREAARINTNLYLSMVSELDVYVATSMRTRQDFRAMANACEEIFRHDRVRALQLRYFDPTMSAAGGHEDKGLIECLMVKCAKALVYCAGEKESWGKDSEAAMALSLGKPVIFYCDQAQRARFYRDVHPLSRLIDFRTGVAVGAIVATSLEQVSELLSRMFENKMEYRLEQSKPGYLRLKEALTDSVVRIQTNDPMVAETFWNHYHADPGAVARERLL
jgi:hypothetical protein